MAFDREDFRRFVPYGADDYFYEMVLYNPYRDTLETLMIPKDEVWEAHKAARDEGLESWIVGMESE